MQHSWFLENVPVRSRIRILDAKTQDLEYYCKEEQAALIIVWCNSFTLLYLGIRYVAVMKQQKMQRRYGHDMVQLIGFKRPLAAAIYLFDIF